MSNPVKTVVTMELLYLFQLQSATDERVVLLMVHDSCVPVCLSVYFQRLAFVVVFLGAVADGCALEQQMQITETSPAAGVPLILNIEKAWVITGPSLGSHNTSTSCVLRFSLLAP